MLVVLVVWWRDSQDRIRNRVKKKVSGVSGVSGVVER